MRNLLFQVGLWLARRYGPDAVRIVNITSKLIEDATKVTDQVEAEMPTASAEAKHARAYSRLGTLYDGARRDVSLAIELALHK